MRRFVSLAVLLFFTVPFGASIAGCGSKTVVQFCNGGDSGPVVGQVKSVTLSPNYAIFGESLDFGQIGNSLSATATDCKGNSVSIRSYTFASSDLTFADINPRTGQVCGGTFNRFSGGGTPDYTTCTAPVNPPLNTVAYVTATGDGAVSNAIPVYIHPTVTSVVIGNPTPAGSCPANLNSPTADPASNCCPISTGAVVVAPPYTGGSCLSQGVSAQISARVYKNGTTNPADNITCRVGHLQYAAQNPSIFNVDQNGVATANQPGSTIVTGTITNSASGGAAGFFSTCPPTSITLSVPGQPANTNSVAVGVNTTLPLTAVVKDINGVTLTGVSLIFNSTTPSTISAGSGLVNPTFPGTATITAECQPGTCNPAPFSQIDLYGNGEPIMSNGIQVTAAGSNATVLYVSSTQSQYLLPIDFATAQPGALVKLPYAPNSMVITQDGSTIYLGSTTALMTVSAGSNQVSGTTLGAPGTVLSVSPNGSTVVISDPARQTVSLIANGAVSSTYGGIGTRAQWSPDSQTVYITANNNQLLVHSSFTGWYSTTTATQYVDVAVTVPSVGAFFATNAPVTEGRSYCASRTSLSPGNPPTTTNTYYPVANNTTAQTDRIAATNDGTHILGATAATTPATLTDIALALPQNQIPPMGDCPTVVPVGYFGTNINASLPLSAVNATAITGIVPESNSVVAFVTYTGTSGLLPLYAPAANGTGALSYVTLSGGPTSAPVAGVFSTDNKTFFAGTSGDNQIHLITITGATAAESSVIAPKLPDANGNPAVPDLIVQRPKKSTS